MGNRLVSSDVVQEAVLSRVAELAGPDGWWKSSTGDTYRMIAIKMLDAGLPGDDVVDILAAALGAAREEYGE